MKGKIILALSLSLVSTILFSQNKKEQIELLNIKIDSLTIDFNVKINQKTATINELTSKLDSLKEELIVKNNQYSTIESELQKLSATNEDLLRKLNHELSCDYTSLFNQRNLTSVVNLIDKCQYKIFSNSVLNHLNRVVLFNVLQREKFLRLNDDLLWDLVKILVNEDAAGNENVDFFNSKEWKQFAENYSNENSNKSALQQDFEVLMGFPFTYDNEAVIIGDYILLSRNPEAVGSEYHKDCFKIENNSIKEFDLDFNVYYNKIQSTFHSDDKRLLQVTRENGMYYFYFSIYNANSNFWPSDSGELKALINEKDEIYSLEYRAKMNNGNYSSWKKF